MRKPDHALNQAEDFAVVPAFELRGDAAEGRVLTPFVFNSPHSGRFYPPRFLAMSRLDPATIRRSEDAFVDELFGGAVMLGAPMLCANFPRAYLDVNREPLELDPRMFFEPLPAHANTQSARVAGGLGIVPRLVGDGLNIYPGRLPLREAVARIETIYNPYHKALANLLGRAREAFGFAVLIDCHSMPANVRGAEGALKPDFIVGDRFGKSACAGLSDSAIELLSAGGYRVARNQPYAGGFITEHYGCPAHNIHVLQIEVNRGLYMNERNATRNAGFEALARDITGFLRELMALPDAVFRPLPLAAE